MPRNGNDARRRLQEAALELFAERGYEATTTAEIASRAGVTERTFFRHFADKREALFDGEEAFRDALSEGVAAAPAGLAPMAALACAFVSVGPILAANRGFSGPRAAVIAQSPALQERVLTKTAGLVEALAVALNRRGVEFEAARLAAQVGMATFGYAVRTWAQDPDGALQTHLDRAFERLQGVSALG